MPYSPKATHFFQAVAHGFKPDKPGLKGKLSPQKAQSLLDEAAQKKALSKMK